MSPVAASDADGERAATNRQAARSILPNPITAILPVTYTFLTLYKDYKGPLEGWVKRCRCLWGGLACVLALLIRASVPALGVCL